MKFFLIFITNLIIDLVFCEIENVLKRERMIEIVNYVNSQNSTWKASIPNRDYSVLLGAVRENNDEPILQSVNIKEREKKRVILPESYDTREAYPECKDIIGEIPDQANCGSCWAIASASVMSDRLCIKSRGKIKTFVSALDLLSCCKTCGHGCNGGNSHASFFYWIENGVVTGGKYNDKNTCKPYFLPECDHHMKVIVLGPCPERANTPECETSCQKEYNNDYERDKSYGKSMYSVWKDEEEIMKEIYENGPVVADYYVYEDFFAYDNGIYKHLTGEYKGGHAVRILGWGIENGVKYWIVSNSWNKNWGMNGVFRIIKGQDECHIESNVIGALPKI